MGEPLTAADELVASDVDARRRRCSVRDPNPAARRAFGRGREEAHG
jgi:hypothetical protein